MRSLNLRDLGLNSEDVTAIAHCFKQETGHQKTPLYSISFSYNYLLGDSGAMVLAKHLPASIREIGLVNCGIGDIGGIELMNWMRKSSNLKMICIEQNNFSAELRLGLKKFSADNPQIIVVF